MKAKPKRRPKVLLESRVTLLDTAEDRPLATFIFDEAGLNRRTVAGQIVFMLQQAMRASSIVKEEPEPMQELEKSNG